MKTAFASAPRVQNALTSGMEKHALIWLAKRVPAAVHSDHLKALALAAQVGAGVAYVMAWKNPAWLWLANLCIALNWLGDSLDGTLARIRNRQRPRYGFYVDHIVDTFGALALILGLGCSPYLHWPVAAGMLVCFYALSIESYLATYTIGKFQLSHGLFGPTEIRILLIIGNIALLAHSRVTLAGHSFQLFDVGGLVAIAGMAAMMVVASIRHTRQLYREEALP